MCEMHKQYSKSNNKYNPWRGIDQFLICIEFNVPEVDGNEFVCIKSHFLVILLGDPKVDLTQLRFKLAGVHQLVSFSSECPLLIYMTQWMEMCTG